MSTYIHHGKPTGKDVPYCDVRLPRPDSFPSHSELLLVNGVRRFLPMRASFDLFESKMPSCRGEDSSGVGSINWVVISMRVAENPPLSRYLPLPHATVSHGGGGRAYLQLAGPLPVLPLEHGGDEPVLLGGVLEGDRLGGHDSRSRPEGEHVDAVRGLRHARPRQRQR